MLQCKANNLHDHEELKYGEDRTNVIEPQGTELLSALAAGNQARIILDISISQRRGVTPSTLALAVAAKQTGGKLICIRPTLQSLYGLDHFIDHDHTNCDANGVTELRIGDPCELIKDVRNVDFAVIDCSDFDSSRLRLLSERLHLNPRGAIIIANNIFHREHGVAIVDQLLKAKRGVESSVTTLPLGSSAGFQLIIKIKSNPQRRRHKRFFVTFDDCI